MSKLRRKFDEREWGACCGSFCKDCKIAGKYRKKFGKKKGKKKFKKDHSRQRELLSA